MSGAGGAERRTRCPHCGSRTADSWRVLEWTRYLCPSCGTYKVTDQVMERLAGPDRPGAAGRLRPDGSWDRWLVAE